MEMESVIPITGAYERGHGVGNFDRPEGMIRSGGEGFLRPFDSEGFMAKFSSPFLQKPFEIFQGTLKSLRPVTLELVSGSELEPVWDDLVKQYHYLGYQKLFGHRLKYLARIGDHPVAALSFSAAALKVGVRDWFIGWSEDQKKSYLNRIANNSRFLILPWVQVPHLASHVLSLTIRRLPRDWEQQFHQPLWLLETFVDPSRFKGTSYKAANWKCLGHTDGFGKVGRGYVHHGSSKEVYVYVLEPRFRKIIGCEPKPYDLFHRPPLSLEKVEELKMILRQAHWNPELVPGMTLTEEEVKRLAEELVQFHEQFHDCFGRIEHRRLGLAYISGLMSKLEAKSRRKRRDGPRIFRGRWRSPPAAVYERVPLGSSRDGIQTSSFPFASGRRPPGHDQRGQLRVSQKGARVRWGYPPVLRLPWESGKLPIRGLCGLLQ